MEDYLRYGLLLLAALILFLILLEAWLRQRRIKAATLSSTQNQPVPMQRHVVEDAPGCTIKLAPTEKPATMTLNNLLVLSVFAKPNCHFASYDLLQTILATGMQFGEMNIFHYYLDTEQGRTVLFSLASATKPGDFDLDHIGDFSCIGLSLFMDLNEAIEPEFAFNRMLEVAQQLAEELDGDLYAGPRRPWNEELLAQYRERIMSLVEK